MQKIAVLAVFCYNTKDNIRINGFDNIFSIKAIHMKLNKPIVMDQKEPHKIIKFCPHCGNISPQKLMFSHMYDSVGYSVENDEEQIGPQCEYFVYICETCNDILLYHSFNDEELELAYPRNKELNNSVPQKVTQCYSEASQIQNKAPNAYAVMIRKALEEICDDRKVKKDVLHKRLKVLSDRGEIPPILAEMTSILKDLGNAGAHSSFLGVTVPLTWGMDEFFRAVVEYVYIAPKKLERFRKKLKSRKK